MRDPEERLTPDGFIATGVSRHKVPGPFLPILQAITSSVGADMSVYVYGSVATGEARLGVSDVDVVALGMDPEQECLLGQELSQRNAHLTRGVSIGAWTMSDLAEGDTGYGNRVFLKHYCAWLSGPDVAAALPRFRGDAAAARGFNGDFAAALDRWHHTFASLDTASTQAVAALARGMGRKCLFAVAGMVSVTESTWTTDRAMAAARWAQMHPLLADDLELLLAWGDGTTPAVHCEVARVLHTSVPTLASQFESLVGMWPESLDARPGRALG